MDHDRLFKQLLTTFFGEFIVLFLPELSAYLKRDSMEFLDKEVFTDLTGGERHEVDLVVRARFQDTEAFFLIHVENQATRQPEFSQRMFRYFARLHEKFGLPVYPIALFSYDTPHTRERGDYEVKFPDRRVLSFHYRVIQLNRLNWRNFLRNPNPVAAALMTRMRIAQDERPKVKLECLRMILTLKLDPARSALIGDFMTAYLTLTGRETAVYNHDVDSLKPKEKRQIVTLTNEWALGGMRQQSIRTAILLLEHRFGAISDATRDQIERLPLKELEELAVAVLDFKKLADVDRWLQGRAKSRTKTR
jgi:hypothetical protein